MEPDHYPHPLGFSQDRAIGCVAPRTVSKPLEGALDESLLGSVLARRPRGISYRPVGIAAPGYTPLSPSSPAKIIAWFEKFLAQFANAQLSASIKA